MDNADAVVATDGELAGKAIEGAQTPAAKSFWRSFTQADVRTYWIAFGATVTGTIASVITVGAAGIVVRWIRGSSNQTRSGCLVNCRSGASPTIPAWAWFAAVVLVLVVSLIAFARLRRKDGKTPAAPAVLAVVVAVFGILVLLGHLYGIG